MDLTDTNDEKTSNSLNQDSGIGYAAFLKVGEKISLNEELWAQSTHLLSGPDSITVVQSMATEAEDYIEYGINQTSNAIELRFNSFSAKGTEFIDGILYKLGDKTKDGKSYYAYSENNEYIKPVLAIDAKWVDAVIGLYDNPPIKN